MATKTLEITVSAELYSQIGEFAEQHGQKRPEAASRLVETGLKRMLTLAAYAKKSGGTSKPRAKKEAAAPKAKAATKTKTAAAPKAAKPAKAPKAPKAKAAAPKAEKTKTPSVPPKAPAASKGPGLEALKAAQARVKPAVAVPPKPALNGIPRPAVAEQPAAQA